MARSLGYAIFGLTLCSFLASSLYAQVGNYKVGANLRAAIAEAWAPTIYHDQAPEFHQKKTGFNPVDSLVGFYFDDNDNVRDNGETAFRLSQKQSLQALIDIPIYFSVIESRTHYYINYVLYHAIDLNRTGHVHDTENMWLVVRKDGTRFGYLEAAVLNSHGYPMIYSSSAERQKAWRSRLSRSQPMEFLFLMDRYAKEHHTSGAPEFIRRPRSKSFKVFVSSKTHALYKLNQKRWQSGAGWGSIYVPKTCSPCYDDVRSRPQESSAIRFYRLVDFDRTYFEGLADSSRQNFVPRDRPRPVRLTSSVYRDRDLPGFLAQGPREHSAKVNLFFEAQFRTPHRLAHPIGVHRFFSPKAVISDRYLYNPYLEREKPLRFSMGSIWQRFFGPSSPSDN